jgi:hypothetical protein
MKPLVCALLFAVHCAALAQLKPGSYVMNPGYGVLEITTDKTGALKFDISVRGANFHTCNLAGVIRNGEARMEDSEDPKLPCIVTFKPGRDGIEVGMRHERTCNAYCGARARFEGQYGRPPQGCTPGEIASARKRFKAAFDRKEFTQARALLTPVATQCVKTLDRYDEGWVLNDLALTQQRLGDNASCQATLKPWLELAQTPDDEIRTGYPPSDADAMMRLSIATRTNMRLCGAPVKIGLSPAKQ